MNWIQSLYETYENCQNMIGYSSESSRPLLPICHTTQNAQIEITLDGEGNFRRASIVDENEARTIIPCTEKSAGGRTSGVAPHPLCEKLQYLAADYKKFGGEKKQYFASYIELLSAWVNSGVPEKVKAIYEYVRKGNVIGDLIANGVLFANEQGKLYIERPAQKDKNKPKNEKVEEAENKKDIFDLLPGGIDPNNGKLKSWQADAFVRWRVEIGDNVAEVWKDPEVIQSWIDYYLATKQTKTLCYVTGKEVFLADLHPAKIRNDGDKAKLISSGKSTSSKGKITIDDGCGFTFLGRFTYPDQAATVGFETTQKAHSALRWLISRQGYVKDDLAVVAWAVSGKKVPQPTVDPFDEIYSDALSEESQIADTAQDMAIRLRNKIAGYRTEIGEREDVMVMAVDSATPGRLSIVYYRAMKGSEFLERIEKWHETCAWRHTYHLIEVKDEKGKTKKIYPPFYGAPAPADIAEAAYGNHLDDKLKKATIKRLLPCIVDGQPIPRDLVESVVRRASNREGIRNPDDKKYRNDEEFTWKKTLSIACALFRKYKEGKEEFEMSLDQNRRTRDYLYGRLLAIADVLEERALYNAGEKRATNAARYMQQFAQRPYQTWKQLHEALTPYMVRLGGAHYYKNLMAQVVNLNPEALEGNKPLSGEYLLGYYCQRQKLYETKETSETSNKE